MNNAVVTCEIKLFRNISDLVEVRLKHFISARGNLPKIIAKLFHRLIAAFEYLPKSSMSLK